MSPSVSRLLTVGSLTALVTGFSVGVLVVGCSRNPPPPAGGAEAKAPAEAGKSTPATSPNQSAANAGKALPGPGKADAEPGKAGSAIPAGPATPGVTGAAKRAIDAEKDKARQAAAEMVPVETALVTRGAISAFLPFNTTLETESSVDIFPQTGGQVEALLVEEGDIVKQGDPLLKIEDHEVRIDVEETSTNFEHLQKNFSRLEDLFKRNLINQQEYEDQRFQVEQAKLRHDRAKVRLAYTTVRAPFDGIISGREAQVGARVSTGTKLFSMVKLDDLVARVFVPGRYLTVVAENQPAVVTSEFLPDRTFSGSVKRISPVIDPKSGTFKVTVGVRADKPSDLPPGLFVGVRIITDTRADAVLIPKRAVVYEGGERYVFAVENNKAVKKRLTAGFDDPNNIEALSGFEVGASVIVLGQSGLKDGQLVRSVNALPAAPSGPPTVTLPDAPVSKAGAAGLTPAPGKAAGNGASPPNKS